MTAGSLAAAEREVLEKIEAEDIDFLRLQFTDILGTVKNVSIPASQAEKAFEEGIYFDGSSIEGFVRIQESDMRLVPDPETYAVLPWRDTGNGKAARLVCDVYNTTTGEPFVGDPRQVLKSVLEEAEAMGYTMNAGPEPEFFVFDDVKWHADMSGAGYAISSEEAAWSSSQHFEDGNIGHRPKIKGGYFPVPPGPEGHLPPGPFPDKPHILLTFPPDH